MPIASLNGIDIYYEETGDGFPLVFLHEFAGDYRSWEPQVKYFSSRYRVIAFNQRGYPPSSVPKDAESYTNENLVEDLRSLLHFLDIQRAHLVGLAMGGTAALSFALTYPDTVSSLTLGGAGTGTINRKDFLKWTHVLADDLEKEGMEAFIRNMMGLPSRLILRHRSPEKWKIFLEMVREHSALACAHLIRGVLVRRKTIYELEPSLKSLKIPTLIPVGDKDVASLEPSIFMHGRIPFSALAVFPMSGHTLNTEEPDLFNAVLSSFLAAVDTNQWEGFLSPATLR